jgi:hypothetical protein
VHEPPKENAEGFVPVRLNDGSWKTASGEVVPWYEVQTDLVPEAEVRGAMERVLDVYGVSDVVVDAFQQLRKELERPSSENE